MDWIAEVRLRTQERLAEARRRGAPPPFVAGAGLVDEASPVVVVPPTPEPADGLPRSVRVAGAWAWRFILFVAAAYLLIRLIGVLRVVVIPVVVAVLLAALFQPVAAWLSRRGMGRSPAAALVLVSALVLVFGGLGLIVQTFISQLDDLTAQVTEGIAQVQTWLAQGPLHISQAQINQGIDQAQEAISRNRGALTSGALGAATTLGEVAAGFFLVLFTLFFFLRDGGQIWTFLCRLLPREARLPMARAGYYSWHTLVSYVHATVLVAFVDAVGIGIGLAVMRVPLVLPLAALVFLGAFIPVVGATLTGAVAVLVALVSRGPVTALIILGVVIAVQQLEGHVLQPLIMGRAVALHPLAVILAIAIGVLVAGIVGGLVAVPLLAVLNTGIRYLVRHPEGEPTPDREPPGTKPAEDAASAGDLRVAGGEDNPAGGASAGALRVAGDDTATGDPSGGASEESAGPRGGARAEAADPLGGDKEPSRP